MARAALDGNKGLFDQARMIAEEIGDQSRLARIQALTGQA
jgi:hypothetical protein